VTSGAAALRYARALFDVVVADSPAKLDAAQTELQAFSDLFSTNEALAGISANPAIAVGKKAALAKALVDRAGAVTPAVGKLVVLLASRDRLVLLPEIARAYRARVMDYQRIVRGEVTTATALPEDRLRALEEGLQRATGRTVVLESRVDPSIIGGVITRLGSTVYDGSVTTQLEKMKQALIEGGQ
jgi:F-type H+-transporting ATPase subunit delta